MKVHFLYGTQSGTAEFLCDHLLDELPESFEGESSGMEDVHPHDLDPETFYVLVCATFGSGELPETAKFFCDALENDSPDLSAIHFAIFGLGDRSFGSTFNNGSNILKQQMLACKARLVGERGLHDASSDALPQDIAVPWLKAILEQIGPDTLGSRSSNDHHHMKID